MWWIRRLIASSLPTAHAAPPDGDRARAQAVPQRLKLLNGARRLLQSYGPETVKRCLWNLEFSTGRWDCLDHTPGDCVYPFVETYAHGGSILDLGCGSGSTGDELDDRTYTSYVGVDVSDVALQRARVRAERRHRTGRQHYVFSDITRYAATERYDVILYRDSIYYVPPGRIKTMLDRHSRSLKPDGVFIVRIANAPDAHSEVISLIESHFRIIERRAFDHPKAIVLVFTAPAAVASDGV
jgi:SAM-dependent methyltransferase